MFDNSLTAILFPSILSGILIWIWPRFWSDKPCYPPASEIKQQFRTSLIALLIIFVMVTLFTAIFSGMAGASPQREYTFDDVIGQAIVWVLLLLPMFIAAKVDGLQWQDFQYRRGNLLPSFVLGNLIGIIFLVSAGKVTNLFDLFSLSGIFAGLQYLIVGFAEETLFRGYIQVRWVAALGEWRGLLLTAFVMSLFHVPMLLIGEHRSLLSTVLEVGWMLPLSLVTGYGLRKSGNIVAPSMMHLWLNWLQTL